MGRFLQNVLREVPLSWEAVLYLFGGLCHFKTVSEIIFQVNEDEADGGYVAVALGHAIATQGESIDELRHMVRDAVRCHFSDGEIGPMPKIIRLHFVRDEALAV